MNLLLVVPIFRGSSGNNFNISDITLGSLIFSIFFIGLVYLIPYCFYKNWWREKDDTYKPTNVEWTKHK